MSRFSGLVFFMRVRYYDIFGRIGPTSLGIGVRGLRCLEGALLKKNERVEGMSSGGLGRIAEFFQRPRILAPVLADLDPEFQVHLAAEKGLEHGL